MSTQNKAQNKTQILTAILSVLVPVFLVVGTVMAFTAIGSNISTGGTLLVNGLATFTAGIYTTGSGTDITLQNDETIDNATDGIIALTGDTTYVSGNVGIGTDTPTAPLDIVGASATFSQILLSHTTTDAASKYFFISGRSYTNSEEPILLFGGFSGMSENAMYLGGGLATMNACNSFQIYTAAVQNTVTGTRRMTIRPGGQINIGDNASSTVAKLWIKGSTAAEIQLAVRGAASQSANLQEWQDSSGAITFATGDGLAGSEYVFNEQGLDIDFRWEASGVDPALFIQGNDGNVGIGHTSPSEKLEVVGSILVTGGSFIDDGTTLNAPDYVFESGYDLLGLSELREFVNLNKHLPNVPEALDTKGWASLSLQDRDMKLLEKIEENTLYILGLNEKQGLWDWILDRFAQVGILIKKGFLQIETLVANKITAKEQICIDDVCITKEELNKLLENIAK